MATKQLEAPKAQTTGAAQAAQNANSAKTEKPETVGEVIAKTLSDEEKKRKELEERQHELEKCLRNIEHKKQLMENLDKFHNTDHELDALVQLVEDEINDKKFDSKLFRIRLVGLNQYGEKNEIGSVSNADLILEFAKNLRAKIAEKVTEIETELMK